MNSYRTTKQQRLERASREAFEWLQTLRDNPGTEDRAAFLAWLHASPLHVRELLVAEMLERDLAAPGALEGFDLDSIIARSREEQNVVDFQPRPSRPTAAVGTGRRGGWHSTWLGAALAASIACIAVLGWLVVGHHSQGVIYTTALSEQRAITLSDGSVVSMAPSTRVEVIFSDSAREITLHTGEANFKVAHDRTRPFRVQAGASIIQAVGTEFSVNRLPSGTVVAVTEGVVKLSANRMPPLDDGIGSWIESLKSDQVEAISRPGAEVVALDAPRRLSAGARAHITKSGRQLAVDALEQNRPNDLTRMRLLFRDDTLADIVAEFNRFNDVPIVIEGEAAQMQRYSGVFDARDSASFLQFLACCSPLSVRQENGRTLVSLPERSSRLR